MNKEETFRRWRLIVITLAVATVIAVGAAAIIARKEGHAQQQKAEARRLEAHRAIDEAIREIERLKSGQAALPANTSAQ